MSVCYTTLREGNKTQRVAATALCLRLILADRQPVHTVIHTAILRMLPSHTHTHSHTCARAQEVRAAGFVSMTGWLVRHAESAGNSHRDTTKEQDGVGVGGMRS